MFNVRRRQQATAHNSQAKENFTMQLLSNQSSFTPTMSRTEKKRNVNLPIMAKDSLDDFDETSFSFMPTTLSTAMEDNDSFSKKEMAWFASGILLGVIAVLLSLELQMATLSRSLSTVAPPAQIESLPRTLFPVIEPDVVISKNVLDSHPILVTLDNHTEPVTVTAGKIAIAEIGFLVAVRALGIPFRVIAYSVRRANIGRRLTTVLHGTKSVKAWQNLIQVYYKTSLSKIVNRSKRFVKIFLPHDNDDDDQKIH